MESLSTRACGCAKWLFVFINSYRLTIFEISAAIERKLDCSTKTLFRRHRKSTSARRRHSKAMSVVTSLQSPAEFSADKAENHHGSPNLSQKTCAFRYRTNDASCSLCIATPSG